MSKETHEDLMSRSAAEPFARLLGMEPVSVGPGTAIVRMNTGPDLKNIFHAIHGGVLFALIDEAFQLACNAHGILSVALNVNITYVAAAKPGMVLEAEANEKHVTRRTSSYICEVREADGGKLIATAQALAYRTGKDLPPVEE